MKWTFNKYMQVNYRLQVEILEVYITAYMEISLIRVIKLDKYMLVWVGREE